MAEATVLGLLQDVLTQIAAVQAQVTALATTVGQISTQAAESTEGVRHLLSDTQMAVLHVQDTLGRSGS